MKSSFEVHGTGSRAQRQPKPSLAARENRRLQLDSLNISRPLINGGELHATLGLAILQAYRPQCIPYKMRRWDELGVTILESRKFDRLSDRVSRLRNVPILLLEAAIRKNLPTSHEERLKWIPVTGLLTLGSTNSPVLALELAAPEILEETAAIEHTIAEVTGQQTRLNTIPHISIAEFPGIEQVPGHVIEAAEQHLPQAVHLAPLTTYSFLSSR